MKMSPEHAALAAMMRQYPMTGSGTLPHFRSSVGFQRGQGLGSMLSSLVRRVVPLFKKPIVQKGLKTIGTTAASALLEAGQKALSNDPITFKQALAQSSKTGAQHLIKEAHQAISKKQGVNGKRKQPVAGTVIKRPRTSQAAVSRSRLRVGNRRDIFNQV